MPRPPLTEAQRETMRARILDTAAALLIEHGPSGLTSRAIAHELGLAHMTLFTYFPNQQAILAALSEREQCVFFQRQSELEAEADPDDSVAILRAALRAFPEYAGAHPRFFQLAWVMPQLDPEAAERARERSQRIVYHLAELIATGMTRGIFVQRDPVLAATVVAGMITFPLMSFASGRSTSEQWRNLVVEEMLTVALDYLTGRPFDHSTTTE